MYQTETKIKRDSLYGHASVLASLILIPIASVLVFTYAYVYWDSQTREDTPESDAIAHQSVEYGEVRESLDGDDLGIGEADRIAEPEPAAEVTETASALPVMPPQTLQQAVPSQAMTQQPPAPTSRPSIPVASSGLAPLMAGKTQPPTSPIPKQPAAPRQQAAPPQTVTQQPPAPTSRSSTPVASLGLAPLIADKPQLAPSPVPQVTAMRQQPPAIQPAEPAPARPDPTQTAAAADKTEAEIATTVNVNDDDIDSVYSWGIWELGVEPVPGPEAPSSKALNDRSRSLKFRPNDNAAYMVKSIPVARAISFGPSAPPPPAPRPAPPPVTPRPIPVGPPGFSSGPVTTADPRN